LILQRRLDGLQAGRAVAALLVVAFHINVYTLPERFYDGQTTSVLFNMGYAGVEFFFVLSGFIIYYIHAKDIGCANTARRFIKRRVLRIFPIYWFILTGLLGLYFISGTRPPNGLDFQSIISSYFLVPSPGDPILIVAWTLEHEMLFYAVFLSLILSRIIGKLIFALWIAGSVLVPLLDIQLFPLNFLFSDYNLLFLFGMIAAMAYKRISNHASLIVFLLGAAIYFGTGLSEVLGHIDWAHSWRTWAYGIGATAMTATLAGAVISPPKWLVFLGDASYSIYLAHLPALGVMAAVLSKLGGPWGLPPFIGFLIMFGCALAAGCLVYIMVERPLMRYFANTKNY